MRNLTRSGAVGKNTVILSMPFALISGFWYSFLGSYKRTECQVEFAAPEIGEGLSEPRSGLLARRSPGAAISRSTV